MSLVAVGKKVLSEMIHERSAGETIAQTAEYLGLAPWHVSYLARFIKVCVSNEESRDLGRLSQAHGFGSVGEFIMDVFHTSYMKHYVPLCDRREKREKARGAAA